MTNELQYEARSPVSIRTHCNAEHQGNPSFFCHILLFMYLTYGHYSKNFVQYNIAHTA